MKVLGTHLTANARQLLVVLLILLAGLVGQSFIATPQPVIAHTVLSQLPTYLPEYGTPAAGATLAKVQKPLDCAVEACVALTFDDGPDAETTPKILDTLEREYVPATFFVIGSKVAGHENILKREQADGFEVGNHTWSHRDLTRLNNFQIAAEITQTSQAIEAAGLPAPRLFRPPYGAINQRVVNAVPMPLIMWNVDPRDWYNEQPTTDVDGIMSAVQPGSIIILHDVHATTAAALPKLVAVLRQRNYKLVTVSYLLHVSPDSRGVYRSR